LKEKNLLFNILNYKPNFKTRRILYANSDSLANPYYPHPERYWTIM